MKFFKIEIALYDESTNKEVNRFSQTLPGTDAWDAYNKAEQICKDLDGGYYGKVVPTLKDFTNQNS